MDPFTPLSHQAKSCKIRTFRGPGTQIRKQILCAGKTSALRAAPLRGAETGVPPPDPRGETAMSSQKAEKVPPDVLQLYSRSSHVICSARTRTHGGRVAWRTAWSSWAAAASFWRRCLLLPQSTRRRARTARRLAQTGPSRANARRILGERERAIWYQCSVVFPMLQYGWPASLELTRNHCWQVYEADVPQELRVLRRTGSSHGNRPASAAAAAARADPATGIAEAAAATE
jgi:hypothetical protein